MPVVTIQPSGKTIEVSIGTTLLAAVMKAGEAIANKCQGKAECGACHIFVLEGRKSVSRTTPSENAKLDSIVGVGSKSRLACQVIVGEEDVTLELLNFASGR
ncbi:2Fe-2S iron-sulfur cluster binding domain-containing protein [Herbaspirillum seropedicae]|uniref:Ferredoxin [2Fe-2S]-type protein n=1 Tax=Herbaspirillum seropedicae (strain SmR1) TaxID=757424 RepID=D8IZL1_HERSS|nr:2Fe-2S iron-sulfur cluster-binding protein [Herbaspirillum seropedicae]ADJ64351.1 ferredoxin [2Fe-2S]-type protein [Herbaspirillum seropedicae SmR1]AKN66287.1 ferredoxin [Herbaspirillum seropedicae]NQE30603.1 ferredoxin [Herbaspirillum seropedicae]UMU22281.1 2Fe-2S iron-sulfur cluster binding domain-containing protein [Herbaspirillum seropedicae]